MPLTKGLNTVYRSCVNFAGSNFCGEVGQDGKTRLFYVQNWAASANGKLKEAASLNNNTLPNKPFINSTGYFITSDDSIKASWESQADKVMPDITQVGGDAGAIIKQLVAQGKVRIIRMGTDYHTLLNSNVTEDECLNLEDIYKKVDVGYKQYGKYVLDDFDDFSFLCNFFNRNNIISPPDSIRAAIVNFYDDIKAKKSTLDPEQFHQFMVNYNQNMHDNGIIGPGARFTEPQGDTSLSSLGDGSHYNSSDQVGHTVDVAFPYYFDGLISPAFRTAPGRDGTFSGFIDSLKTNSSNVFYEQKMILEPINYYFLEKFKNGKRILIPYAITRSNDTGSENVNIGFGSTDSRTLTPDYAQFQEFSEVWGKAFKARNQMAKASLENPSDGKVIILDASKSDTISRGFNNTLDAVLRAQKYGENSAIAKKAIGCMEARHVVLDSINQKGWIKATWLDKPGFIFIGTNPSVGTPLPNENFQSSAFSNDLVNVPVDSDK